MLAILPANKKIEDWSDIPPPTDLAEDYYAHCQCMADDCYHDLLKYARGLMWLDLTAENFVKEYIGSVIPWSNGESTEHWPEVSRCYENIMFGSKSSLEHDFDYRWKYVKEIFDFGRSKHNDIRDLVVLMSVYWAQSQASGYSTSNSWWVRFRWDYLRDLDSMEKLPICSYETIQTLARNIGHDVIAPDAQRTKLANDLGFNSQELLCEFLSSMNNERIGVVDLVLQCGSSVWG